MHVSVADCCMCQKYQNKKQQHFLVQRWDICSMTLSDVKYLY
jgi:hypothetical protein